MPNEPYDAPEFSEKSRRQTADGRRQDERIAQERLVPGSRFPVPAPIAAAEDRPRNTPDVPIPAPDAPVPGSRFPVSGTTDVNTFIGPYPFRHLPHPDVD